MSILRADSIRDRAGTGAPDFPNGLTGNLTGTATTATTLSGTPNITVGTVTGTDATFSGNLTVQGTTTTIDTAVTSVDSLAVDGDISAGTKVLAGLTTTTLNHPIQSAASSNAEGMAIIGRAADDIGELSFYEADKSTKLGELQYRQDHLNFRHRVGEIRFATGGTNDRLIINSVGTAIFKAGLAEKFNNTGTTMSSGTHAIQSGNIIRFTGNESGANALNITGIHSTLANGEALSFTVICTPNGSGYISGFNIDGVAPATAIKWSGGSAPSAVVLLGKMFIHLQF